MKLFKQLFGGSDAENGAPDIKFGRYTDSYKSAEQYQAWDQSLQYFEQDDYLKSFHAFFEYLKDEKEGNVHWKEENNSIHFEIFQGSKRVHGVANARKLKAEAKVAKVEKLNMGFMRRLIEQNYDLKYGRFALDNENDISILFDTYTLDSSPYKLYYALKEIATTADKHDDLLTDEFESLKPIEIQHVSDLPNAEKEIKYQFIQEKIQQVFKEIDDGKLKEEQYPGAIAYLLLDLCFRLDYLITPEGFMMELLERIHRQYFVNDKHSTAQKNAVMRKEYSKLQERSKEDFFQEMYRVKATFGITTPVSHDKVISFIDGELHHMDWYIDHGHQAIALAIPGYIIGYCQFNFSVPPPVKELFHLYYQITDQDYFQQLGYSQELVKGALPRKKAIKQAIEAIEGKYKREYPDFKPELKMLIFNSMVEFVKSYLQLIRALNVTRE